MIVPYARFLERRLERYVLANERQAKAQAEQTLAAPAAVQVAPTTPIDPEGE